MLHFIPVINESTSFSLIESWSCFVIGMSMKPAKLLWRLMLLRLLTFDDKLDSFEVVVDADDQLTSSAFAHFECIASLLTSGVSRHI